ncbi:MAG: bifunctional riboflavin kinase/FAD synthetase [Eubacterium sp.]|nr:bifunctional riboflavin kinase/FAD synthetase [Eubacterium sp.]
MNYLKELSAYRNAAPSVVTLGKFDGVHLGHRLLLSSVLESGRREGLETVVFTFDVSPQAKLGASQAKSLMTNQERFSVLQQLGIQTLIECPFTKEIQMMTAEAFVREVLLNLLHASKVVVGDDFHFGRGRAGSPEFLQKMAETLPFRVLVIGKRKDAVTGREISSTWVREELLDGQIETVNRLLGEPYFLLGEVVHGRALGRTLEIPTINQIPRPDKLLPPNGVYFSRTRINEKTWDGITNIGTKPTVNGEAVTAETHLFDCDEDLYGKTARVELLRFHRHEQKFSSVQALKEQMLSDIRSARDFLTVKL